MYKNEQYALGNWIGEQRKKYKKGTLKPEQVEALEKVGMVWELVDRDVWEKRYNDAYAYYNEHGNIDVSPNVLTAGNMYLRDWRRRACIKNPTARQTLTGSATTCWMTSEWTGKSRLAENPTATHIERRGIIMNSATWMCRRIIMT